MTEQLIVQHASRTAQDDESIAHHEAGHAVAMWLLGLGIKLVTIKPTREYRGHCESSSRYYEPPRENTAVWRSIIEQTGTFLHAGDVAARFIIPGVGLGQASTDHHRLHQWMGEVEDDASVQNAWCIYLWQLAYDLLQWPPHWFLVTGLARQLLRHRSLRGAEAMRYLQQAHERLKRDPQMPNIVMLGDAARFCSPWHRTWYQESATAQHKPKRIHIPDTIADLSARADSRPISWALKPLSTRAANLLARIGIRTVADLHDWNEWSLSGCKGGGRKTVAEIIAACDRANVPLAPPTRQMPWQLNPQRWSR